MTNSGLTISRPTFLDLLKSAMIEGEFMFCRQVALTWLTSFPGDLQVSLFYAKALEAEGRTQQAYSIARGLAIADPENIQVIETLYRLSKKVENRNSTSIPFISKSLTSPVDFDLEDVSNWKDVLTESYIASESVSNSKPVSKAKQQRANQLVKIRQAIKRDDLKYADENIHTVLAADNPTLLSVVTHLRILDSMVEIPVGAKVNLAQHYHKLYADCLACNLFLAKWLVSQGDGDSAISLLHHCVTRDVSGDVAKRLWGDNHTFRTLWRSDLSIKLDNHIPSSIIARMGWNRLVANIPQNGNAVPHPNSSAGWSKKSGDLLKEELRTKDDPGENLKDDIDLPFLVNASGKTEKTLDVEIIAIKKALDAIAQDISQPKPWLIDGRYPIYVIFSVFQNLVKKYGQVEAEKIEAALKKLSQSINTYKLQGKKPRLSSIIFFADRDDLYVPYHIKPVKDLNPWGLKLSIADLEAALARKGQMISALLIVGGPDIIPFHELPNPVDDLDGFVLSDNPYGTRDENYFITEWPVGRLPGGSETKPDILLESIHRIQGKYTSTSNNKTQPKTWFVSLTGWLQDWVITRKPNLGYTAEVWKDASSIVYKPIGKPKSMLSSPPLGVNGNNPTGTPKIPLPSARLGYFNLHGLIDASDWYGQRQDAVLNGDPEYPVALRPDDIDRSGMNNPKFIFSEACYGAHITDKTIDDSIALKYLSAGSDAVVGSTCMSYGSISSPLIAADLLGYLFWRELKSGIPTGEALRKAKLQLAVEMNRRQGYLDGEDQKTLISFVLYGDPLAVWAQNNREPKSIQRDQYQIPQLETICDRVDDPQCANPIPIDVVPHVKKLVANYLPGMADAKITYASERPICNSANHNCPTRHLKPGKNGKNIPDRHLVLLQKEVNNSNQKHPVFARLTLDSSGKLVKMVVSR